MVRETLIGGRVEETNGDVTEAVGESLYTSCSSDVLGRSSCKQLSIAGSSLSTTAVFEGMGNVICDNTQSSSIGTSTSN